MDTIQDKDQTGHEHDGTNRTRFESHDPQSRFDPTPRKYPNCMHVAVLVPGNEQHDDISS